MTFSQDWGGHGERGGGAEASPQRAVGRQPAGGGDQGIGLVAGHRQAVSPECTNCRAAA